MEKKNEVCCPFLPPRNTLRKTCAEIVSEARQSLRVQSTRRPFTPRDEHRQLYGSNSATGNRSTRPPSAFSLHSKSFDAADSRPNSGTRLLPLDHRPKFPADDAFKAFPKPPADPLDTRRGSVGARPRLFKAGSLTTLLPLKANTDGLNEGGARDVTEKSKPDRAQLPANHLLCTDLSSVPIGSHKSAPRRAASESEIVQPVDSEVGAAECKEEQGTEPGFGNNAASAEQETDSLVWKNKVVPLLQELESLTAGGSDDSVDHLCDLCERLHRALADADMLGRHCKGRSGILRTLFRLIDLNSAQLNLRIAELCFALCVSGKNLLNICKLVFQISRSENNDVLFKNSSVIDLLLGVLSKEDVCVSGEALVYCVGTLKFISGNSTILELLLDKNCIGIAQKLIHDLCAVKDDYFSMAGHIFFQLTATLRNLADHPDSRPLFVSFHILPALCLVLRHHCEDEDICTNISRIYSKLSSYSECRLALAENSDCYPLFLELLGKHHQNPDLVVRFLFTLGNLTSKSDESRLELFRGESSMRALFRIYALYQRKGASIQGLLRTAVDAEQADDVLVKLVTVLANICIHPDVGPRLATNPACVHLLMETLELRSVEESEELMVKVAVTLNNLSFYQEENSEIRNNRLTIAKLMIKLMLSSSLDAMLEAARVYGNLSQYGDVRDFIMLNKVYRFVVALLDSKSSEICLSACGVLTNLATDPPNRMRLTQEGATTKLVDCLRDLGPGDWQLAGQTCQAVWNLTAGGSAELINPQDRERLQEILTVFSDENEALSGTETEQVRTFQRSCWEVQFLPCAQKLLHSFST